MSEYEEGYTLLRDLKNGDVYIDKANCVGLYLKSLGNDRHLIKSFGLDKIFKVPHGRFPVFKKIIPSNHL